MATEMTVYNLAAMEPAVQQREHAGALAQCRLP